MLNKTLFIFFGAFFIVFLFPGTVFSEISRSTAELPEGIVSILDSNYKNWTLAKVNFRYGENNDEKVKRYEIGSVVQGDFDGNSEIDFAVAINYQPPKTDSNVRRDGLAHRIFVFLKKGQLFEKHEVCDWYCGDWIYVEKKGTKIPEDGMGLYPNDAIIMIIDEKTYDAFFFEDGKWKQYSAPG